MAARRLDRRANRVLLFQLSAAQGAEAKSDFTNRNVELTSEFTLNCPAPLVRYRVSYNSRQARAAWRNWVRRIARGAALFDSRTRRFCTACAPSVTSAI